MASDGFRCSEAAEERNEPLYGTASVVRNWLLVEQPGSWGHDALSQSSIPSRVADELRRRARAADVRVILIRRGVRRARDRRQCYLIRTTGAELYQAHLELERVDDLLDVDLTPLRDGGPVAEAAQTSKPLFLVCTHGRHDRCCSIRGNQVSRVACAHPGVDAWECSHIGGDRFAANLVCFPHGIYYGRVAPADVVSLMDAYALGSLSLQHYRGRCSYAFPIQAAEYFARRESGTTQVDGLALARSARTESGIEASFTLAAGGEIEVEVRISRSGEHRLTCRSSGTDPIPIYELVSCHTT